MCILYYMYYIHYCTIIYICIIYIHLYMYIIFIIVIFRFISMHYLLLPVTPPTRRSPMPPGHTRPQAAPFPAGPSRLRRAGAPPWPPRPTSPRPGPGSPPPPRLLGAGWGPAGQTKPNQTKTHPQVSGEVSHFSCLAVVWEASNYLGLWQSQ